LQILIPEFIMPNRRLKHPLFITLLFPALLAVPPLRADDAKPPKPSIAKEKIAAAEALTGVGFSDAQRELMGEALADQLKNYQGIRIVPLKNGDPAPFAFDPVPPGFKFETERRPFIATPPAVLRVPKNLDELAYAPVAELGELIRTKQVSSEALTRMYLDRIKKYDPKILAVITVTEDLAIAQAKQADAEIAAGKYRGPLHGIPYGAKDLLAVKGYPTTWGAPPYKTQTFAESAAVIKRLEAAGAVLIAKTSLGELAMDDVWFGGRTNNPWNLKLGSSGSSAGSAAGVSAAFFPFAIGSETWGSIVSPATVCGVTGLRPTFGRVSRQGAMALSWSMDKLGPICRTVEDCALILDAIRGADGLDPAARDAPFNYDPAVSLKDVRIGYMKEEFDKEKAGPGKLADAATLKKLEAMGATLIPIEIPKYPINDLQVILLAESGAAFDELTRSHRDDQLVQQAKDRWPNIFRASRFIPAVEYLQASRIRNLVIRDFAQTMETVDVYLAPSLEGDDLLLTNLTGHPAVVVPNGFDDGEKHPTSITFIGKLYGEAKLLAVAKAYQDATKFHLQRPLLRPAESDFGY
jgi:Asp-tRNA(Asn)/Glu-tRNA(Gln) amidotransferase A subunit family amidase